MDSNIIKIAFIGGGNMGEAILAAVMEKKLSKPEDISVSDVKQERREYLKTKYAVEVTANNRKAVNQKDVVLLAVKPQDLAGVMAELKDVLKPSQLVLSIIAGARVETLCRGLGHNKVVRVMPNTPSQIGAGMSAWTATNEVSGTQREQARSILSVMGREIYFDEEKYLDIATAVSGSGPAYFFFFAEVLVGAAVNAGLSPDVAREMVLQTMLGSAQLIQKTGKAPAELRLNVTSPGGTTAAAIKVLEEGRFAQLINDAVQAAYKRAQELGK